eukprot:Lithocolla_globosa_v1_NODE_1765_length_2354_cov_5.337103.p1 type:complete len:502 gc:universal NODE_1765_length_2354_cov_5.337103:1588-83(-)
MLLELFVAVLVLFITRSFLNKRAYMNSLKENDDCVPPNSHWFFGHLFQMFPNGLTNRHTLVPKLLGLAESVGKKGVVLTYFFGKWVPWGTVTYHIVSPEMVQAVTASQNQSKFKKGKAYDLAHPLIGNGLLSASGDFWKTQRKLMEPAFRFDFLKGDVVDVNCKLVAKFGDSWLTEDSKRNKKWVTLDLQAQFLRYTLDAIGLLTLDYDFKSVGNPDPPLFNSFQIILQKLVGFGFVPNFLRPFVLSLPLSTTTKIRNAFGVLDNIVDDILVQAKEKSELRPNSLLSLLLQAEMTPQLMKDNIKTFLFAGHDTTANALSWAFYHISQDETVEKKLLEEIREHVCSSSEQEEGSLSFEQLERMTYLNAFVKEVLRLHPSAGFTKEVLEDTTIGGFFFPKGINVSIFPMNAQCNPNYVKSRATEFRPDRWLEEGSKAIPYFPFSLGPRNCIGSKLALIEMRVAIIKLLTRFEFRHHNSPPPSIVVDFTFTPWYMNFDVREREL